MSSPKVFISYSWSNSEHQQWVIDFATELRESSVDVILDKWELKEGHDAVAFMEQMVTNPEIKKVIIVCDAKYAAKADGRAGGVGTETQIISRKVYENQSQDKFVAVITENDLEGKPCLPTYYKARIYIDLTESDRYADSFERLLRWIFDKPLYVKPALGAKPSFLSEGEHIALGTTAVFRRCVDALRNQKAYAAGALDEYCATFAANLERFRLSSVTGEYDEALIKNIEEFIPNRNEAIQLFAVVAQYSPTLESMERIHRLFESLIPYMQRPASMSQHNEWDFDNFKFLVHELFLYALAILLKHQRLDQANHLLEQQYYVAGNSEYGRDAIVGFTVFLEPMTSLDRRKKRLELSRISLRADLLKERCKGTGVDLRDLMQADFVAFMRTEIENTDDWNGWWPETLVFLGHFNSAFEIFARSVSKAYFDKVKVLLKIDSPKDLEPLLKSYKDGSRKLPKWHYRGFSPGALLGFEHLATRP